ncbi:hypothetical protein PHYBOEH_001636 [Phytophthora boehmeriae]|uniref:Uncharacterized protein n=1 Tax=Phytophthora boehmeriae TaxID=109152 RepID=A0A8T1V890_9STRA|nr:hypothetical protein PHYBOEH_001636 [Phytophthora boehmeriae]
MSISQSLKDLTPEELKARRREQWRVNKANQRKRVREKELQALCELKMKYLRTSAHKIAANLMKEASNLTTDEWKKVECRGMYHETERRSERKTRSNFMAEKDPNMSPEEWKKARLREQRRINQANYWKRKRLLEERLVGEIAAMSQEIELMQIQRQSMSSRTSRWNLLWRSTALSSQREEFDSMASFKFHWSWYRSQFRDFRLRMTSYVRLEAGEHVIIKASGNLLLEIDSQVSKQGGKSCIVVCPVLQQFEFEKDIQLKRITSEVDLIGGVANTQRKGEPERILETVLCLLKDFTCPAKGD